MIALPMLRPDTCDESADAIIEQIYWHVFGIDICSPGERALTITERHELLNALAQMVAVCLDGFPTSTSQNAAKRYFEYILAASAGAK